MAGQAPEAGVSTMLDVEVAPAAADLIAPDDIGAELAATGRDKAANGEWMETAEHSDMVESGADGEDLQGRRRPRRQVRRAKKEIELDAADADYANESAEIYDEDASDDATGERAHQLYDDEAPTADITPPDSSDADIEIVVVGGARPALDDPAPDEAPGDEEQPSQVEPSRPQMTRADDQEASRENEEGDEGVVGGAGRPLPLDQATQDVDRLPTGGAPASHTFTGDEDRLSEKARRTEVIRVGEHDERDGEGGPRRGWWQRLLS